MNNLTKDDIIEIHQRIQNRFNTTPGIKNEGLIESVAERPDQILYGKEVFPDIYSKAASLFEAIARWHMFIDGNKRTALAATQVYLKINGYFQLIPLDVVRLSVHVAQTKAENEDDEQDVTDRLIKEIAEYLEKYSCDFQDINKVIKVMSANHNFYKEFIVLSESNPEKALSIYEKWMTIDIYPEYEKDVFEVLQYLSEIHKENTTQLTKLLEEQEKKLKSSINKDK